MTLVPLPITSHEGCTYSIRGELGRGGFGTVRFRFSACCPEPQCAE